VAKVVGEIVVLLLSVFGLPTANKLGGSYEEGCGGLQSIVILLLGLSAGQGISGSSVPWVYR
jgi:hypothetical protein